MKHHIILPVLAALSLNVFAQAPGDGSEADKDALRALGRLYEEAINSGNLKVLANAVEPGASAVFMTGDEVTGVEAMQLFLDETMRMLGAGSRYTVKLVPDTTEFFGDVALAKGTSDESATLGSGQQYSYTTHWTAVLRKTNGQWKAARLHVSINPFDNPIVTARMTARSWLTGGIAALAGLGLGFFLGRVRRRKTGAS